jgi:hypothetical protein
MTDTKTTIRERLSAAKYAVACAKGGGAFGVAEHRMLEEYREHALDDLSWCLDELDRLADAMTWKSMAEPPPPGVSVLLLAPNGDLSIADPASLPDTARARLRWMLRPKVPE